MPDKTTLRKVSKGQGVVTIQTRDAVLGVMTLEIDTDSYYVDFYPIITSGSASIEIRDEENNLLDTLVATVEGA